MFYDTFFRRLNQMIVYIDGYRSHNLQLSASLLEAVYFYAKELLGGRQARHLTMEIKLTKELKKKTGAYGLCHIIDDDLDKPREFMVELDASMGNSFKQILIWLAHEMVHVKQFVKGELWDYEDTRVVWKSKQYSNKQPYNEQPWEKEVYRLEEKLFNLWEKSYG